MKRNAFLKALCCLLAVCLLSGCTSKSPLLANADDTNGLEDTVSIELDHFCSVKNAEGKELRWFSLSGDPFWETDSRENYTYKLEGTMEYHLFSEDEFKVSFATPFSKTFTVSSVYELFPDRISAANEHVVKEIGKKLSPKVSARFDYTDDSSSGQSIEGDWSRIVFHCNKVTELYGDLDKFNIFLFGSSGTYDLEGSGGDHVIVALVDGEIKTEGMVGNYTVTHTNQTGDKMTTIVREYDETGNLLSTTEE